MSEILDIEIEQSLSIDEFFDYVLQNIKIGDDDSMLEHAWALRALANNRQFVLDSYHEELGKIVSGKSNNDHQPQSLPLRNHGDFYLRANIWLPIQAGKRTEEFEKRLYAYDLPHDHNFSFLTIGYFGLGYETDIYTYDRSECRGFMGEAVAYDYQGRYQLKPGRIIEFRSGRDIHVQYVPEDISVSLNLLCRNPQSNWQQQYIFNLENRTLAGGAGDVLSNRLFLVESVAAIGDQDTAGILVDLIRKFPCPKTKAVALQSLGRIAPAIAEEQKSHLSGDVLALAENRIITGNFARSYTGG